MAISRKMKGTARKGREEFGQKGTNARESLAGAGSLVLDRLPLD